MTLLPAFRRFAVLTFFVFGLLLVCAGRPACAWDSTGHMVVARLAWDNLSPAARAAVSGILTHSVDYGKWLAAMPPDYPNRPLYAFMRAATWPDDIRGTSADRPAWHYIDVPVAFHAFAPGASAFSAFVLPAPVVPNAETELEGQTYVLTLAHAAPADRADALCWVEHLVGDIHQPLHCASLFGTSFPAGDRGGNLVLLAAAPAIPAVGGIAAFPDVPANQTPAVPAVSAAPAGSRTPAPYVVHPPHNLHALWDDLLGSTTIPSNIDIIARSLQAPAYARAAFPQLASRKTVPDWVMESNALAAANAYGASGMLENPKYQSAGTGAFRTEPLALPDTYVAAAQEVAKRQIALAAYRLADTLNAAFSH